MVNPQAAASPSVTDADPHWLRLVREHVRALRFGIVQVVVHEGRVVQIEKTERLRFDKPRPDTP